MTGTTYDRTGTGTTYVTDRHHWCRCRYWERDPGPVAGLRFLPVYRYTGTGTGTGAQWYAVTVPVQGHGPGGGTARVGIHKRHRGTSGTAVTRSTESPPTEAVERSTVERNRAFHVQNLGARSKRVLTIITKPLGHIGKMSLDGLTKGNATTNGKAREERRGRK